MKKKEKPLSLKRKNSLPAYKPMHKPILAEQKPIDVPVRKPFLKKKSHVIKPVVSLEPTFERKEYPDYIRSWRFEQKQQPNNFNQGVK